MDENSEQKMEEKIKVQKSTLLHFVRVSRLGIYTFKQ